MRVLLDECLPQKLRKHPPKHDVATAVYLGWSGVANGALLRAAEDSGVEVLLTGDQGIAYQNNLVQRKIAVVVLSAVSWKILKHHLVEIAAAVDSALPGSFTSVQCGVFQRPQR